MSAALPSISRSSKAIGTPPMPAPITTTLAMSISSRWANATLRRLHSREFWQRCFRSTLANRIGSASRASRYANNAVERARADDGGQQRNDADPTDDVPTRVGKSDRDCVGDQQHTENNSRNAVEVTYILAHEIPSFSDIIAVRCHTNACPGFTPNLLKTIAAGQKPVNAACMRFNPTKAVSSNQAAPCHCASAKLTR